MLVKMTNDATIELWKVFQRLTMKELKLKASWAIMRNMERMKTVMQQLQELSMPYPKFKEFEEKRLALCEEYCKRNANKEPIMKPSTNPVGAQQNEFDIRDEDQDEFTAKVEGLREEYQEAIDAQIERDNEWRELLKEEIELDLYTFDEKYLSDDTMLTPYDAKYLSYIVNSEPEATEEEASESK